MIQKIAPFIVCTGITLFAAGCTTAASDEQSSNNNASQVQQCNANSFQSFVGQKLAPEITENIRTKAGVVRVLRPNDAATMEYNPARVNVHLDKEDRITMITCG